MLFDTHTHLNNDSFTDEERVALAAEIEASDVGLVMDVGFDEPSSLLAAEHANRYPWCYAVIGMHPHDSKLMDEAMLERFRQIASTMICRHAMCSDTGSVGRFSLQMN